MTSVKKKEDGYETGTDVWCSSSIDELLSQIYVHSELKSIEVMADGCETS